MNVDCITGNQIIEKAIAGLACKNTGEGVLAVLEALQKRMAEDGYLLIPVELPPEAAEQKDGVIVNANENLHFVLRKLRLGDGREALAAYTGREEVSKGQPTSIITLPIRKFLETAADTGVRGVVLNPWGSSFFLPADVIRMLLASEGETRQQNESDHGPENESDFGQKKESENGPINVSKNKPDKQKNESEDRPENVPAGELKNGPANETENRPENVPTDKSENRPANETENVPENRPADESENGPEYEPQNGIYIELGDITQLDCECIVNAANESLLGGGGVDGAIHLAAGPGLLEECRGLHGCRTGEAKITGGYRLKAKYVIHTVGPVYSGSREDEGLLADCYWNCLELAKANHIHSIAFPAISAGTYRYPLDKAAPVALSVIAEWLDQNRGYGMEVILCCLGRRMYDKYREFAGGCDPGQE